MEGHRGAWDFLSWPRVLPTSGYPARMTIAELQRAWALHLAGEEVRRLILSFAQEPHTPFRDAILNSLTSRLAAITHEMLALGVGQEF